MAVNAAPKILVSIVNWNNTIVTNKCLAGIAAIPKADQPDIIVVDNHSTSQKFDIDANVTKNLRSLKVVMNPDNKGFAGGHNPNIRQAQQNGYDYIFLLNNDSEIIDKSIFVTITRALAENPKALGANPTILSRLKPDIIWYGGGQLSLSNGSAGHLRVGQKLTDQPAAPQATGLLTGCCLAISLKQASLENLLLSEKYFLYWEDTDWSARALKAGFELLYVPEAKLLHHVSDSLGVRSPNYIYYNIRNHFLFVKNNLGRLNQVLALWNILVITAKYKFNILFRYDHDRIKSLKTVWRAWFDGLRGRGGRLQRPL